jgi:tRNA (cmo5U34)-methyltransferase
MGKVGDGLVLEKANWKFSGDTVAHFDDHVSKSVPLYHEGHELTCELSDFFIKADSVCYEIGCSTGELTLKLATHNAAKPKARFIGVDIEPDMITMAGKKSDGRGLNVQFIADDVVQMALEPADLIVCYYVVQFIRPSQRQRLIDKLFSTLQWGGALVLFEKVRAPDARFQDIAVRLYDDYKLRVGYTPEEIVEKARSIKGVQEPFSTQGNIDMLKRAGFLDIMTIQKYICFEGFLAIK